MTTSVSGAMRLHCRVRSQRLAAQPMCANTKKKEFFLKNSNGAPPSPGPAGCSPFRPSTGYVAARSVSRFRSPPAYYSPSGERPGRLQARDRGSDTVLVGGGNGASSEAAAVCTRHAAAPGGAAGIDSLCGAGIRVHGHSVWRGPLQRLTYARYCHRTCFLIHRPAQIMSWAACRAHVARPLAGFCSRVLS